MADSSSPGDSDSPPGVFGNLPSSRPGSRSPRRAGGTGEPEAAAPEPEPKPEPATTSPAAEVPPDPAATEEPPLEPVPPSQGIHGIEDLAWAGVTVAAQAATVGIKFASRALGAARKSIDRP